MDTTTIIDDRYLMALPILVMLGLIVFMLFLIYRYRFALWYIWHVLIRRWKLQRFQNDQDLYLYDALICFSSADDEWVWKELRAHLESGPAPYSLCLHDRDFPLGAVLIECLDKSLSASRKVVLVLSQDFIKSPRCRFQLDLFVAHDHLARALPIVILLGELDDSSLPSYLKRLINTCPYVRINNPQFSISDRQWSRIKAALGPSLSSGMIK